MGITKVGFPCFRFSRASCALERRRYGTLLDNNVCCLEGKRTSLLRGPSSPPNKTDVRYAHLDYSLRPHSSQFICYGGNTRRREVICPDPQQTVSQELLPPTVAATDSNTSSTLNSGAPNRGPPPPTPVRQSPSPP